MYPAKVCETEISCEGCPVGPYTVYSSAFALNPNDITIRRLVRKRFDARHTILREGDVPQCVFTLYSGWAYSYKVLPDGSRQVLAFFIPGDLVTLYSFLDEYLPYSIKALTPVTVCGFDRIEFFRYLQDQPALRELLCRLALDRCRSADELLIDIARRPAAARVARFLLGMEKRLRARGLAGTDRFALPIPQTVMADALGLTPVYLNRTLVSLRKEGVIELRHREAIIRQPERLKEVAAGDRTR